MKSWAQPADVCFSSCASARLLTSWQQWSGCFSFGNEVLNFFDVIDLNFEDFDKIKRAAYWRNERLFVQSKTLHEESNFWYEMDDYFVNVC